MKILVLNEIFLLTRLDLITQGQLCMRPLQREGTCWDPWQEHPVYTKGTGWVHIPRYRMYIKGPRQRPPTHGGHPPFTGEAFKTGSTVGFKRTNKGKMYRFSFDHAVIENQWNCILEAQRKITKSLQEWWEVSRHVGWQRSRQRAEWVNHCCCPILMNWKTRILL